MPFKNIQFLNITLEVVLRFHILLPRNEIEYNVYTVNK